MLPVTVGNEALMLKSYVLLIVEFFWEVFEDVMS